MRYHPVVSDALELEPDTGLLRVEWRLNSTRLAALDIKALNSATRVAMPVDVRKRLRGIRGCITWGRFDLKTPAARGSFCLDAPSRAERLALARLDVGLAGEPLWMRQLLRAQMLLNQEFVQAAMDEARAVLA